MTDTLSEVDPVEVTVQRMAELHAEHTRGQSKLQRRISGVTTVLAHPRAVAIVAVLMIVWVVLNSLAAVAGFRAWDAAPFALLELVATVVALLTTLMILATQAREEEASRHRAQLTLQLASLSEQKIAKVIALLEEQRRDNAALPDRPDREADDMAKPADPRRVLERIKDTHERGEPLQATD